MSDSDKKDRDEQTTFGGGPPAAPKLPAAPPRPPDSTQAGGAPPVLPPRPPAPAAAPPPVAASAQPAPPPAAPRPPDDDTAPPPDSDEDKTVLVARDTSRPRVTLSRVRPPGHSDSVALGPRDAYLLGRAPTSDVRLYSPTASREHARLTRRGATWFLTPCEGKPVLANGSLVRDEVALEHRMRLQLGEDELLVIDEAAAVERSAVPVAAPAASPGHRGRWWIIGGIVAAAIAAATAWVLGGG